MKIDLDLQEGKVEAALASAREFARARGADISADEAEGDVLLAAKRFDDAGAAYTKAHRTKPSGSLAIKLFKANRAAGSPHPEEGLIKWVVANPSDLAARQFLAGYYQASAQPKLALAEYEQMLRQRPDDPAVLNNLAWLVQESDQKRARKLAQHAYELAPGRPEIADTYGWILVQMGEVKQALSVLESALKSAPGNGDIQYHVAMARAQNGDRASATAMMKQLLASDTAFASRPQAEQFLKNLQSEGA